MLVDDDKACSFHNCATKSMMNTHIFIYMYNMCTATFPTKSPYRNTMHGNTLCGQHLHVYGLPWLPECWYTTSVLSPGVYKYVNMSVTNDQMSYLLISQWTPEKCCEMMFLEAYAFLLASLGGHSSWKRSCTSNGACLCICILTKRDIDMCVRVHKHRNAVRLPCE